jgi:hypothetical protein
MQIVSNVLKSMIKWYVSQKQLLGEHVSLKLWNLCTKSMCMDFKIYGFFSWSHYTIEKLQTHYQLPKSNNVFMGAWLKYLTLQHKYMISEAGQIIDMYHQYNFIITIHDFSSKSEMCSFTMRLYNFLCEPHGLPSVIYEKPRSMEEIYLRNLLIPPIHMSYCIFA